MGDSRKIKVLEDLFIIGFPEKGGSTITVNSGVVVEGKDILANWIKTDARVIHGNSGGAAVDVRAGSSAFPQKLSPTNSRSIETATDSRMPPGDMAL